MSKNNAMKIGFGKVDITPFENTYLGGYGGALKRFSTEILDNFYALTLALTDKEDNTLLLIVTDMSWGRLVHANIVREKVFAKYGIPADHVVLAGVHNHNAPDITGKASGTEPNLAYREFWFEKIMESVEQALTDRKEIESTEIARGETKGLAFVRRYWRADGNFWGGGPKKYSVQSDSPAVRHESEGDEGLQLLRWKRRGGKDIVLSQWQNHGCHFGNTTVACTDWMGPMRQKIEDELDCHCFYIQGAAGNLDTRSRIEGEHIERNTEEYGHAVADAMLAVFNDESAWTSVACDSIRTMQDTFTAPGPDETEWEGELNILSLGDVSIITLPVELFSELGKEIKDKTPYKMTMLMGYANSITGYVPHREGYKNGGYEILNQGSPDTGERFVETCLTYLKQMQQNL